MLLEIEKDTQIYNWLLVNYPKSMYENTSTKHGQNKILYK